MKLHRLGALALLTILMGIAVLLPLGAAQAATQANTVTNRFTGIPVTGTASNGGTFKGVLNVKSFSASNGTLYANGVVNGVVKNKAGQVVAQVTNQAVNNLAVALPTTIPQASCTILTLNLGPLDLNVLGLMIHLNQVVLDITANPAGGLLGQLLCSIANLLSTGGALSQIVADLNQIIAILGV